MSILSIISSLSAALSQGNEINKEIDPSSNFLINNVSITVGTILLSLSTAFLVYRCFKSQETPSKASFSAEEIRKKCTEQKLTTTSSTSAFSDNGLIIIVDAIINRLLKEKLWEFEGAFRESASVTWLNTAQDKLKNAASKNENLVDVINSLEGATGNNLIGLLKRMCASTNKSEIFKNSKLPDLLNEVCKSKVCGLNKDTMVTAFPVSKSFL